MGGGGGRQELYDLFLCFSLDLYGARFWWIYEGGV